MDKFNDGQFNIDSNIFEKSNELTIEVNDEKRLTGKQKAAILMVALGNEVASDLFKKLSVKEVESLVLEISKLGNFSNDVKLNVLKEFNDILSANEYINMGGVEYARSILESSLDPLRASEIINRIIYSKKGPFDLLRKADVTQIQSLIQKEMPQTIALLLSYLEPKKASDILASLSSEQQTEVARRIATIRQISPDMLRDVDRVLEQKITAMSGSDVLVAGGIETAVEILNVVERGVEKNIIESIEDTDPELAEEIKKRMFIFDDIVLLDDRSIQRVIQEVDNPELAKALKGTTDRVREKLFSNMSSRASELIKEEIEYMGPVRLREVEEVQQKIVTIIRRLEEQGEVVISRGEQETFV